MPVLGNTNVTPVAVADLILQPALEGQFTTAALDLAEQLLRGLGQLSPVMVRTDNVVYFNTAIVIAARRLGWETVDCIVSDDDLIEGGGSGAEVSEEGAALFSLRSLLAFGFPIGPAGGGLGGSYPNPTVDAAPGLDTTAVHYGDDILGPIPRSIIPDDETITIAATYMLLITDSFTVDGDLIIDGDMVEVD